MRIFVHSMPQDAERKALEKAEHEARTRMSAEQDAKDAEADEAAEKLVGTREKKKVEDLQKEVDGAILLLSEEQGKQDSAKFEQQRASAKEHDASTAEEQENAALEKSLEDEKDAAAKRIQDADALQQNLERSAQHTASSENAAIIQSGRTGRAHLVGRAEGCSADDALGHDRYGQPTRSSDCAPDPKHTNLTKKHNAHHRFGRRCWCDYHKTLQVSTCYYGRPSTVQDNNIVGA